MTILSRHALLAVTGLMLQARYYQTHFEGRLTDSGIVGMQDPVNSTFGLVGVAPEAEIGMYREFFSA